MAVDHLRIRGRVAGGDDAFSSSFVVDVALKSETIANAFCPIDAKSSLYRTPCVEFAIIRMKHGGAIETLRIGAVVNIAAATALSHGDRSLLNITASGRGQSPLSVRSLAGNDVNDAVHGVRSPNGPAGAANHFDPVDVFHHRVLHFPVGPRQQGGVDSAAIDQD